MTWITWAISIIRTKLGRYAAIALAVLAGLGLARAKWRSDGRSEAMEDVDDADRQNADEIRRRARDADGHGVQPDDRRGFRD